MDKLGLDAALFMRFTRMMRNIFTILAILGCGVLIPVNALATDFPTGGVFWLTRMTPTFIGGSTFWVYVVAAYVFDGVIFYFLWANYRAVLRLRRNYFDSLDYQRSLHARTLMLTDIPTAMRSDEGIVKITEDVKATGDVPRAAIARDVKDLPDLIQEHEETVRRLEKHLARYLKNPNNLPAKRPTCKVNKNDKGYTKGQEVDAIEYLTARIKELEREIKEVRLSVDKRNAQSYGFASYESIAEAHSTAYVSRKGAPQGSIIRLATKPHDLIWKNLPMKKKERDWQNFINNLWVAVLTVVWVAPNILISVFLSNLSNLGAVWPAFKKSLNNHTVAWGIVQGIAAPAITTFVYFFLPAIFRRLVTNAGDVTRSSRERHVMHKLFSFFLFNNLIVFSLFSAFFAFGAQIVDASRDSENAWDDIVKAKFLQQIIASLIAVSPYWCSWLLQRNLGAAVDLGQLVKLTWGHINRRYFSQTPREVIENSAPQPFDYATYYNYFLFYAAVALSFGVLQPLALAITALYFWLDSFAKKYLLLYIFITKYESGGMFWRTLFNRMLVGVVLSNIVTLLLVASRADNYNWPMLAAMVPLFFLIAGFKWYCVRTFDDDIHYYHTGKALRDEDLAKGEHKRRKGDRVGTRFGHPALFKPLMTPMVSEKSQHMLKSIYSGRTSLEDARGMAGYSDVYMDTMDQSQLGKSAGGSAPFEVVSESQMDFEHFKSRPEFGDEYGGEGELYGRPQDMIRPGTPSSMMTGPTRTGTWESGYTSRDRSESNTPAPTPGWNSRSGSRDSSRTRVPEGGVEYPRGYHQTPSALREQSPAGSDWNRGRDDMQRQQSREGLATNAARMGRSPPPKLPTPEAPAPGGYGPIRYDGQTPMDDETSYDYFRRGR